MDVNVYLVWQQYAHFYQDWHTFIIYILLIPIMTVRGGFLTLTRYKGDKLISHDKYTHNLLQVNNTDIYTGIQIYF